MEQVLHGRHMLIVAVATHELVHVNHSLARRNSKEGELTMTLRLGAKVSHPLKHAPSIMSGYGKHVLVDMVAFTDLFP